MLQLTRLTIARQRRVAQSLAELDAKATKPLHADVRATLAQVVAIGARLDAGRELPPLVLDRGADAVFIAFDDLVGAVVRGLSDQVVSPLTPEQAKKKAAASTLHLRVFPDGAGYFHDISMPLQYDAMRAAMDLLRKDAECTQAVKELALGWLVDHLEAHLAPYGRAIKAADGRDLEAESDAFHQAFTTLAVQVQSHHAGDEAIRKQLLGAYETELSAQREADRAARRARKQRKEEPKPVA